jgi:zinc transport system permease protein
MTDLLSLLSLPAVLRGLVAMVVCGIFLPVAGVAIVALNIYPLRFTIMHTALLGLAVGGWLGAPPGAVAMVLCAATGAGLGALAPCPRSAAAAMGFLMPVAIALAFLVLAASGVHATDAFALLWGSVLVASWGEVGVLAAVGAGMLGLACAGRRQLALYLLDPELAWTSGVETRRLGIILLSVLAVAMAASVRLTGALLVDAVTILPALTARAMATSLTSMTLLAMAAGLAGNLLGFALALVLDVPPGPILVITAGGLTLAAHLVRAHTQRRRS